MISRLLAVTEVRLALQKHEQVHWSSSLSTSLVRGTAIEKGIARLMKRKASRTLRTESEPPQSIKLNGQHVPVNFDKILTQQSKPRACSLAPLVAGSKSDWPSSASGQKTARGLNALLREERETRVYFVFVE